MLILCYSQQAAPHFDSQLLVAISPEVCLKQTSLLPHTRLTYTQFVFLADIEKQHMHHRARTFPEVSDGRGCFYTPDMAELKAHYSHPKHRLQFKWHHSLTVKTRNYILLICVESTSGLFAIVCRKKIDCSFVHSLSGKQ